MTELTSKLQPHDLSEADRLAYAGALIAIAATDGQIDREELSLWFDLVDQDGLSDEGRQKLRGYLLSPPDFEECLSTLREGSPTVRYALMLGLVDVAFSDGTVTEAEHDFLALAQEGLGVRDDQLQAMEAFTREARLVRERGLGETVAAEALKTAASGLTAVGVPLTAVYFSGVVGFSAAGITSGLAALGLGFGMIPGIGVVIALGAAGFVGVNWLLRRSGQRKKAVAQADRERRAQLVIARLQESINDASVTMQGLQASAEQARVNADAIKALNGRLLTLQQLLASRQAAGS